MIHDDSIFFNRLCYTGNKDLDNSYFLNVNFSKKECEEHFNKLNSEYKKTIPRLIKYLNLDKNFDYPINFWNSIFYHVVFPSISIIDKYEKTFEKISTLGDSYSVNILANEKINFDFVWTDLDSKNQLIILSTILKNNKYKNIRIQDNIAYKGQDYNQFKRKSLKQKIYDYVTDFFILRTIVPGYGINFLDSIYIFFKLKRNKLDKKIHKKVIQLSDDFGHQMENWKIDLIIRMTPNNFINLLSNYILKYKNYNFKKGRINLVQNLLYSNSQKIIYYNLARLNGEKLVTSQHGGQVFYNDSQFRTQLEFDKDAFLAWGNEIISKNDQINSIIIPSPLFSKLRSKDCKRGKKVILIGTSTKKYNATYWGWFVNNNQSRNYRKTKLKLIRCLKKSYNNNFYYRPHHANNRDSNFDDKSFYSKKIFGLKIFEGDIIKFLRSSKLLILDHPGTALSIGFALNIPMILYLPKKEYFSINNDKSKFFNDLKSMNILHSRIETLEMQLKQIELNPNWWENDKIQLLRHTYLKNYALLGENWRNDLISKLNTQFY